MSAQDARPYRWRYPDVDDKNFRLHGHHGLILLLIAFAIFLFFTLLFVYLRWACRGRRRGLQPTVPGPHPHGPSRLNGLDPRVIGSLPVLLYRPAAGGHDESDRGGEHAPTCSICLGGLVGGEKVKVLPRCMHVFHPECIDEWLQTRSSCPMCRACIEEVGEKMGDDGEAVV